MKCDQGKYLEAYIKGTLHKDDMENMASHIRACESCTNDLQRLSDIAPVINKVKSFEPRMENPELFKRNVLKKIEQKRRAKIAPSPENLLDKLIYFLVQPAVRYSFMSAAAIIFGVFIYQQTIIVQKIGSLEKRIEVNSQGNSSSKTPRRNIGTILKNRQELSQEDKEFNELLKDHRALEIKHQILLRILEEKYPDTYQEVIKEMDNAGLNQANTNI